MQLTSIMLSQAMVNFGQPHTHPTQTGTVTGLLAGGIPLLFLGKESVAADIPS